MVYYQSEASQERQTNGKIIQEKFQEIQKIIWEIAEIKAGDLSSYKSEVQENRQKIRDLLEENQKLKNQIENFEDFQKTANVLIEKLKADWIVQDFEDWDEWCDEYWQGHWYHRSGVKYMDEEFQFYSMSW